MTLHDDYPEYSIPWFSTMSDMEQGDLSEIRQRKIKEYQAWMKRVVSREEQDRLNTRFNFHPERHVRR